MPETKVVRLNRWLQRALLAGAIGLLAWSLIDRARGGNLGFGATKSVLLNLAFVAAFAQPFAHKQLVRMALNGLCAIGLIGFALLL